jgi:Amt family ammonium transporter
MSLGSSLTKTKTNKANSVVTVQWFLFGFSLAFSENGSFFAGTFDHAFLSGIGVNHFEHTATSVPSVVFVCKFYQLLTL